MKKTHMGVQLRLISNTSRLCTYILKNYCYASSSPPESIPKSIAPFRIKREPTDILKALASTVKQIPNAPAYKFYDDPYLYAISYVEKNTYALSKESGKKAARYIRDNYPQYFNHHPDDPIIKEFAPKTHFDENSEISEIDLCNSIRNLQVSDSEKLYRLCQAKNIEVGADTRQSLLELVSFYNGEEPVDADWLEERDAAIIPKLPRPIRTWNDSGFAEELFGTLKDDTKAEPYCALIRGMCKYNQADRAWQLFQECVGKKLLPDVGTFNAVLSVSYLLGDDNAGRWGFITDLLEQMVTLKVHPNLGTLNGILEALYQMRRDEQTKNLALRVLAEFKQLGIEPSLASYFHVISIFHGQSKGVKTFLPSLLDIIEQETFTIKDPRDVLFFCNAMDICRKDLQSFQVAQRLLKMMENGKNYVLLGGGVRENSFYRSYLMMAADALPMDEFMEIYDSMIPHGYSIDKEVASKIVQSIGVHDTVHLLPRVWSDLVMLKQSRNESLMEIVLMVANGHNLEEATPELREQLKNVAWDIWSSIQDSDGYQSNRRDQSINWSGQMLGDCIGVVVRCGDLDKAVKIVRTVIETAVYVIGEIPIEALKIYYDAVLKENMYSEAMLIIKYVKENGYPEAFELAKQLQDAADLPESIKMRLKLLFDEKRDDKNELVNDKDEVIND